MNHVCLRSEFNRARSDIDSTVITISTNAKIDRFEKAMSFDMDPTYTDHKTIAID